MQMGKPKECNGIRKEWRIFREMATKEKEATMGGKMSSHDGVDDDGISGVV
jgi:hypothetical protein